MRLGDGAHKVAPSPFHQRPGPARLDRTDDRINARDRTVRSRADITADIFAVDERSAAAPARKWGAADRFTYLLAGSGRPLRPEGRRQGVGFMLGEVRLDGGRQRGPDHGWIEVLGRTRSIGGRHRRRGGEAVLEHFRQRGAHAVSTLVDEGRGRTDIRGFFAPWASSRRACWPVSRRSL